MPLRTTYANQLNVPLGAISTSNTFTTATDIIAGTVAPIQPPCVIPANYFEADSTFAVRAYGTYSVTTATTPTIIFTLTFGSAVLLTSATQTAASGVTTLPWRWESESIVRQSGLVAAGLIESQGILTFTPTSLTTAPVGSNMPQSAMAPVAVDTTVANVLTLKATYSASSATNIIVTRFFAIIEYTQS